MRSISTLSHELLFWLKELYIARGISYLLTKTHRVTGIFLSLYLLAHIYTLSGLAHPTQFQAEMNFLQHPFFMFLEWCLVIPLAFHAFNGGRLILFELFEKHDDTRLIKWSLSLSALFIVFMGLLMALGTEHVSSFLFWSGILVGLVILVLLVWDKVWPTFNKTTWKLQRVTGAALIPFGLGHFLFMHLSAPIGHDATTILTRMKHPFIFALDLLLLTIATLHAWYGLQTVLYDNFTQKLGRKVIFTVLTGAALLVYGAGLRLLILVSFN